MISLAGVLIYQLRLRGCMEAPSWRHTGINNEYHNSVAAVLVAAVTKVVVAGCVSAVTVMEEVDDME